jgi:ornithine carrier protein
MLREFVAVPDQDHAGAGPAPLSIPMLCLSGGISGVFASMVLTPVELVKCKLQVQQIGHLYTKDMKNGPVPKALHNGPLSVVKSIYTQHGLRGFYLGHLPTFLRETGGGAAWFGSYEAVCRFLISREQSKAPEGTIVTQADLRTPHLMTAGALAGMAYNFILFPADCIKSHMQTQDVLRSHQRHPNGSIVTKKGFLATGKEILRSEGIRGLYRGCGITVARSAPSSAIIFLTYVSRNFALRLCPYYHDGNDTLTSCISFFFFLMIIVGTTLSPLFLVHSLIDRICFIQPIRLLYGHHHHHHHHALAFLHSQSSCTIKHQSLQQHVIFFFANDGRFLQLVNRDALDIYDLTASTTFGASWKHCIPLNFHRQTCRMIVYIAWDMTRLKRTRASFYCVLKQPAIGSMADIKKVGCVRLGSVKTLDATSAPGAVVGYDFVTCVELNNTAVGIIAKKITKKATKKAPKKATKKATIMAVRILALGAKKVTKKALKAVRTLAVGDKKAKKIKRAEYTAKFIKKGASIMKADSLKEFTKNATKNATAKAV